jgi:hypothetical protein
VNKKASYKRIHECWLLLVLLTFAPEALAWGLQTHLFFAHYALLAVPFLDPELRAAAARLPGLVLAGACLPDLALAGKVLGTPVFRRAHRWSTLRRLAAAPRDDAERALALGYASHLVTDVVAHNLFVPEQERRLAKIGQVTHAIAEWAMDDYIQKQRGLDLRPVEILAASRREAAAFTADRFRCSENLARRALRLLGRADGILRSSPAPRLCRGVLALYEKNLQQHFEAYILRATRTLRSLEPALAGRFVDWESSDPEGHRQTEAGNRRANRRAGEHVARIVQAEYHP